MLVYSEVSPIVFSRAYLRKVCSLSIVGQEDCMITFPKVIVVITALLAVILGSSHQAWEYTHLGSVLPLPVDTHTVVPWLCVLVAFLTTKGSGVERLGYVTTANSFL